MIRVYNDTKIYVQCPAGVVTGGVELLHQLVSYLRERGLDAYIVYFGDKPHSIPSDYSKYNIKTTIEIEDSARNISVLCESLFPQATESTKIQKILWWLSVDNFFISGRKFLSMSDLIRYDILFGIKTFIRRMQKKITTDKIISLKEISKLNIVSAYQSEYAQHFLLNHGFKEIVPLKDYINTDHCSDFSKSGRQDIVLYNPKKGLNFTKALIKLAPDIKWIPIINMSRKQLIECMKSAKVYIDFGYHPGKDRLPRECAMNGLCIITGSRGSARYFEDVWLENKYKFDEQKSSKKEIVARIRETLRNYEDAIEDFALYRSKISAEKAEFEEQIEDLFFRGTKIV